MEINKSSFIGQALITLYGVDEDREFNNSEISAINTETTRLQAEYDGNQYQRDRKVKYDALNQLELISDDAINGTTTHKDAILAIKAEIPKQTGE